MRNLDHADQELAPGQPWDKPASESMKAFRAFAVFRDIGPPRSLSKAAAIIVEDDPRRQLSTVQSQLKRWSARHRWVHRAEAYDIYIDQRLREIYETEIQERHRRFRRVSGLVLAAVTERFEESPRAGVKPLDPNDLKYEEALRVLARAQQISDRATHPPLVWSPEPVSTSDLVKVAEGFYAILMRFVPERDIPRAARQIQLFVETGKDPLPIHRSSS